MMYADKKAANAWIDIKVTLTTLLARMCAGARSLFRASPSRGLSPLVIRSVGVLAITLMAMTTSPASIFGGSAEVPLFRIPIPTQVGDSLRVLDECGRCAQLSGNWHRAYRFWWQRPGVTEGTDGWHRSMKGTSKNKFRACA